MQLALILSAIFFAAGLVKGVVGFGLPTVSLGLLCLFFDLRSAVVLLLLPSFFTNVWQSLSGGEIISLFRRFWHLYLFTLPTIFLGVTLFDNCDQYLGEMLLGALLLIYASYGLSGFSFVVSDGMEKPAGIIAGLINGIFTGVTGSFVFPGVMYLQSTGLKAKSLIQAMGMLFTISTLGLALALLCSNRITISLGLSSMIGVPATVVGFVTGFRLRGCLTERQFKKILYFCILGLGFAVLIRAG